MIELTFMDKDYQVQGFLDQFTSLVWTRRYYDIGEFELHTPLSDFPLLKENRFIWSKEFSEVGVIEEYGYTRNDGTAYCKGRFLESLLAARTIDKTAAQNGTPDAAAMELVRKFAVEPDDPARKIAGLYLAESSLEEGETVPFEPELGKSLWESCMQVLKPAEKSLRIRYDHLTNNKYIEVWQGRNRTIEQEENPFAIFSDDYENVESPSYSYNNRDFKNFAYVAGEEKEDVARVIVEVDQTNGEERREVWIDARDLRKEEETTDEAYRETLKQRGIEKLAEYKKSETVNMSARNNNSLVYKQDYDLGDICTYIDDTAGVIVHQRITEITEAFENGSHIITPTFGEDTKTILQKVRRGIA